MPVNLKKWRDAASLILIAKTPFQRSKQTPCVNYKLLTLKRSSKSSFMPDNHVFPGGAVDEVDSIKDWMHLFENCGINKNKFEIFNKTRSKTPIFENRTVDNIDKNISLRITAIRETFEETGILLCKKNVDNEENLAWASYFGGHEIKEWQKKVHDNSFKFLELCCTFKIFPDIWALHEWSNWLTPSSMAKRFDTIFFIATLQNIPPFYADKSEAQHCDWASPYEYLQKNENSEINLAPPQVYEISRLMNFQSIESLASFSKSRSVSGCERFLPYRIQKDKMIVTILPGDELYPGEESAENPKTLEIDDDISNSTIMNRIYHISKFKNEIKIANLTPKFGHVLPVTDVIHCKQKL